MNNAVVFINAFLIDGNGGEPYADAGLAVQGDMIEEIFIGGRFPKPVRSRVIDLKGKTLMPGLIDAHVHPGNVEWTLSKTAELAPAVYVHRVTRTLETDLNLGFTTVRDAAGLDAGFRNAVEQDFICGPRLFLSVTPLTQPEADIEDRERYLEKVDPRNSLGIYPEVCAGPDEMRAAVRRTLDRGADQIKVFADGEVVAQSKTDRTNPGQAKFSIEELKAAVEAAAAAGSYVMAHAYCPEAIQNCLQAGVHSIEHGNLMDIETARMMAQKNTYYVPTLTVYDVLAKEGRSEFDACTVEKLETVGCKGLEALETAYKAGVKIGSGSDIIGPLQHLKGRELALKAEVMTPMEAIVSATRTNAEMIGMADRFGTLERGKLADLIVVDGNPLENLHLFESALKHVVLVMKKGKIVKNTI
jgi:imidazolonepropionase-like amidohydrolase